MALIGTIRKQSGLLVIIVGVALAAFVLGDFLSPRSGNRQAVNIAEVMGEDISYTYFDNQYEKNVEIQKQNQNKDNLTSEEVFRIKQQTFDQIVQKIILDNQYDEIGLHVTADELFELIQGDNPHAYIKQYFKDPETQQYDPELVRNYMKQLDQMDPNARAQWEDFVAAIKEDRLRNKYKSLISQGYYMPDTLLYMDFVEKKTSASVRLVAVPFKEIQDSAVNLTDEKLRAYYEDYKYNYEQDESRDIEYVVFNVNPSAADRKRIREDVADIFEDFKMAENVPLFVNSESDNRYDSTFFKQGELPLGIDTVVFNAEPGAFVKPYIHDNAWHMAKLMEVEFRPDSMKASHVLISYAGAMMAGEDVTRTKAEAEKMADSLLNVVKNNPGRMESIASEMSDDPSAADNSGDLGWFADGSMVYPFNQAVLTHDEGDITMAESRFGYHIIKVTGKKEPAKKVRVAVINIAITPSQDTYQDVFAQASEFQGKANSIESFDTLSTGRGLSKRSATYLTPMTNRIAGIEYPRTIIQWAYTEGIDIGDVSNVFTMDDKYVVAILTAIHEKGIPDMEDLRDRLEPLVIKDLKGDMIVERMKQAKANNNSLPAIASALSATVDTLESVFFNARNIAGYGNEPDLLAKIFSVDPGTISEPVKGNNAAFIIEVDKITPAPADEDYTMYNKQMLMNFRAKVSNNSFITTLQDNSGLVDNRVRFY
ncbi:MAG: peptidylprolyl isomerase [Bacteroidales bacterium]|nr:peptidylprolyl isomerase [Bacteroidales bacterium]